MTDVKVTQDKNNKRVLHFSIFTNDPFLVSKFLAETAIEEPAVETPEQQAKEIVKEKESEKPDVDKENNHGRKPPEIDKCRNCKRDRPLNRFKLCYACWVESEITDREKREGREWKAGDKHPDWCMCEGLGEHQNQDGTSRGLN